MSRAATSPNPKTEPSPERVLRRALLPWLLLWGAAVVGGLQSLLGALWVNLPWSMTGCFGILAALAWFLFVGLRFTSTVQLWRGVGSEWRSVRGFLLFAKLESVAVACVALAGGVGSAILLAPHGAMEMVGLLVPGVLLGLAVAGFVLARWTSNTLNGAAVKRWLVERHPASSRVA